MSTYSGIRSFVDKGKTWIVWSAANTYDGNAALMIAEWDNGFTNVSAIPIHAKAPANNALPNEIETLVEKGNRFLYAVLNGNNELVKIKWSDRSIVWSVATGVAPYGIAITNNKIYVSNWAGELVKDSLKERAGVP